MWKVSRISRNASHILNSFLLSRLPLYFLFMILTISLAKVLCTDFCILHGEKTSIYYMSWSVLKPDASQQRVAVLFPLLSFQLRSQSIDALTWVHEQKGRGYGWLVGSWDVLTHTYTSAHAKPLTKSVDRDHTNDMCLHTCIVYIPRTQVSWFSTSPRASGLYLPTKCVVCFFPWWSHNGDHSSTWGWVKVGVWVRQISCDVY